MEKIKNTSQIRSLCKNGVNIMKLFRDMEGSDVNSMSAILTSYDLQAGSYVEAMSHPKYRKIAEQYSLELSRVLYGKKCESILEAGVGEATTLISVVQKMKCKPKEIMGFDISWSRIHYARQYAVKNHVRANLIVANMMKIPIISDSVDIVYTSHSIEPNRGNEESLMLELYRIARSYLILFEPSNELGSVESKKRIEQHKYCKDLRKHAMKLGFNIIEHRLLEYGGRIENQTAVLVIDKGSKRARKPFGYLACPDCKTLLLLHKKHYYCLECLKVYPVIDGIPCLMSSHAVLASKYLETSRS